MKTQVYQKRSLVSRFLSQLGKNITALFNSNDKREFQRLKNFIAS
ncbi:MAG TPA: hypothetical protein PLM81_12700 [Ginsengibacter sp.]|nr:hypothetical protein [Ginsengibacter sp.]HRP45080.1 hypothetical protein [Ginsengibacter sp.]